tara:strand:- start:301 stop:576 length:276 start_codon:yes stop_codon:yes gene_type:complete
MKLIKVTKGGALHFELSDGRLGVTYPSGYVRVSLKTNYGKDHSRLYQINKQIKNPFLMKNGENWFTVKRELIPLQRDRINHLFCFNNMNCR